MNILSLLKKLRVPLFILAAILFAFLIRGEALSVTKTLPERGQDEVSLSSNITIVFNKEVKKGNQEKVKIEITPETSFEKSWSKKEMVIIPKDRLKPGASYSLSVSFNEKVLYQFSFETILFSPEQIEEEGALQSADDLLFGEAYKGFAEQYPWYRGLPIETVNYRVVYDFERSSFRIRIKNAGVSPQEEETIIKEILEALKKIGVPEPISYYTLKGE